MTYDPADILAAQEHFGFASPVPVEKDWHMLRAMCAIASVDARPFRLVFAGGTCLARAHKLIRRMSEDMDFKITPLDTNPVSKTKRRKKLGDLRDRITASLQASVFRSTRPTARSFGLVTTIATPSTNFNTPRRVREASL